MGLSQPEISTDEPNIADDGLSVSESPASRLSYQAVKARSSNGIDDERYQQGRILTNKLDESVADHRGVQQRRISTRIQNHTKS